MSPSGAEQRRCRCRALRGESLAKLSVRVYAQACEARVGHLRTKGGEHEVDLIVEGTGGRVVGIEVKLARAIDDDDDGIAVLPLALLGP